jgi:hypothetical protein
MNIAVIADTHDRLPAHVMAAITAADEIWHLGDVCRPEIVEELRTLGPKIRVVRGNCDDCCDWPLTLDFALGGRQFHLEHIPARVAPEGSEFFLHGHTHVPRDETIGGVRFLNPGCITRPNRGAPASFAWLRLGEKDRVQWELVRV